MKRLLMMLLTMMCIGTLTACDFEGPAGEPGDDGISVDGDDGEDGQDGEDGEDGTDGEDGADVVTLAGCEAADIDAEELDACTHDPLDGSPVTCTAGGKARVLLNDDGEPNLDLLFDIECTADFDSDGAADGADNCDTFNPDQADLDGDGAGDVCDDDIDGDNILNVSDFCPAEAGVSVDPVCDDFTINRYGQLFRGWDCKVNDEIAPISDPFEIFEQNSRPLDNTCFNASGQVFLWTRVDCNSLVLRHWPYFSDIVDPQHGCPAAP